MENEESYLKKEYEVTDLCYFAATLDPCGELINVPKREKIKNFDGRVHLVVALVSNGQSLTHFALNPDFPIRKKLIKSIIKASENFDGVQIDFEQVLPKDCENYFSFLEKIKKGIGNKTFSVAVAAKTSDKAAKGIFDYKRLSEIADRIVIMAYDEHFSKSKPGPIASMEWCKKVSNYCVRNIPTEKLVLGLPFYGRAWASTNPAKAYKYSSIKKLLSEKKTSMVQTIKDIPYFTYKETVNVTVYFENSDSILNRAEMYYNDGARKIGFWRLGQEDVRIWETNI
jgi:spore germination protein YaaH